MQIFDSTASLDKIDKGLVLTIGNFDGVHLGHQKIIAAARSQAKKLADSSVAVMTFDPHPVAILHPEKAPGMLTPLSLKKHLLKTLGTDCLIILRDSYRLLNLSPKDFVDEFLLKHLKPAAIVEGKNFNFGYGRSGNIETLRQLCAVRDVEVIEVPSEKVSLAKGTREEICSSTLIRGLLEKGRVAEAGLALRRNHRIMGQITAGRGVGAKLGFPTANIQPANQVIPAEGVYAGFVEIGQNQADVCASCQALPAAFSIGRAKTFISEHPLLTEAHILENNVPDLHGKWMAMDFVEFIRPQMRFETSEQLACQISEDCLKAKRILTTTKM